MASRWQPVSICWALHILWLPDLAWPPTLAWSPSEGFIPCPFSCSYVSGNPSVLPSEPSIVICLISVGDWITWIFLLPSSLCLLDGLKSHRLQSLTLPFAFTCALWSSLPSPHLVWGILAQVKQGLCCSGGNGMSTGGMGTAHCLVTVLFINDINHVMQCP